MVMDVYCLDSLPSYGHFSNLQYLSVSYTYRKKPCNHIFWTPYMASAITGSDVLLIILKITSNIHSSIREEKKYLLKFGAFFCYFAYKGRKQLRDIINPNFKERE